MIKIAHKGNYAGQNVDRENTVEYIEEAIAAGYNVKVDAWLMEDKWMLGQHWPATEVPRSFFERPEIWTHAKNLVGYVSLYNNPKVHVFWHNKDDFAITSKGIKWARNYIETSDGIMSIAEDNQTMKGRINGKLTQPLGICCDSFDWLS
jgi:hypothetical protein